jgi:mycothiol synthase
VSAPRAIAHPSVPDPGQVDEIRTLIATVAAEDGRDPLSDQALTQLGSPAVEHAVVTDGGRIVGYGQLAGDSLEIVAEPQAVGPVLAEFGDRPLLVWSHGEHSRVAPVLAEHGYVRERELFQLRRPLTDAVDVPAAPAGIDIRPFVTGRDEDAWVAVNAAAFAHHPEQGSWTRADIEAREAEPWFEPAGFLLAWQQDRLVGFHWTKVHPDGAGEVYVIGVDPSTQGSGLGRTLLYRGLALLRERGCPEVLLYVDGSNDAAMRLYERTGFARHDLDVQWRSPAAQPSSTGSVSNT